jgi:peptide/nickel transport system substrate-binding protein
MRKRGFAALVTSVVMATAIIGPATAQDESVLTVARLSDHQNWCHPIEAQTGNQGQWWENIFNKLVKSASDSTTIVPDLAESWEPSANADAYTFKLAENATWHDGEPVTADDVVFTIEWFLEHGPYGGFTPAWQFVENVAAVDDFTVQVDLVAPNAEFLRDITGMANIILPEHVLNSSTAENIKSLPFTLCTPGVTIGSGPYELVDYAHDTSVELAANDTYFKGRPNIDRIVFKIFPDPALAIAQLEAGELDLAFRVPPEEFERLDVVDGLNVLSTANAGIVRIVFATEKPPWNNVDVRRGFAHAINKDGLVNGLYQGRARILHNHPGFNVTDDINLYEYDPDKARELLEKGGYNGETFTILYDGNSPEVQAMPALIQNDLAAVGVNVELSPQGTSEGFVERLFNNRDAEGRLVTDDGFDASTVTRPDWDGFFHIGGSEALSPDITETYYAPPTDARPIWLSGFWTQEVADLWAAGRATADQAERDAAYNELGRILNDGMYMLHLYTPDLLMAATDRLGGGFDIHLNERDSFMDVETWTLDS